MELHDLKSKKGANKSRKRLGRGSGSGLGTTSGRGTKGQKSRSGGGVRVGFEGGQMPLTRRLPKRGFNNSRFAKEFEIVNLNKLNDFFEDGDEVSCSTLKSKGLIRGNKDGVKVLGSGDITKKLIVNVDKISKAAVEKIKKLNGEFVSSE